MTSRLLLTDLLNEIEAVTEYTEPQELLRPTDTVHKTECSVDLKKVFTLRMKYGTKVVADQMTAMICGVGPLSEVAKERETEFKATILNALLWQLIAIEFPPEKQELIGIRKGWVLVTPEREMPLPADFNFDEDLEEPFKVN